MFLTLHLPIIPADSPENTRNNSYNLVQEMQAIVSKQGADPV